MAGLRVKLLTARLWLKRFDKARNLDSPALLRNGKIKQGLVFFSERHDHACLDEGRLTTRFNALFNCTGIKTNSQTQKKIAFYGCEVSKLLKTKLV